jgi:glycerol-3-phosphate acyltransferase PlsY
MPAWLMVLIGYLIGGFPTAFIAGRVLCGRDIRRLGDENAGAANVYRELGPRVGILVGIIDAAKGALIILIARALDASTAVVLLSGAAAVVGHNWPIYLGFRGGRGVSTTIGVLLALVTIPLFIMLLPTLVILLVKKNVTVAMAFLFIGLPLVDWWFHVSVVLIFYGLGLAILVGFTHFLRTRVHELRRA